MVDLSIIILSYNTKTLTEQCLISLLENLLKTTHLTWEVIVIDNHSTDGSVDLLKKFSHIRLIVNAKNVGYPRGNNQGLKLAKGRYLLFLNSDTIIKHIQWKNLIEYLDVHTDVGVLTVKVLLPNNMIDPASHRGFPTIWNSLCYFSRLEAVFRGIPILNRLVGGYHLTYLNNKTIHETDSPSGAFYLTRKDILNTLGGFDESYFMYGEDIDLAYRTKQLRYKILYYPRYHIVHVKHASGLKADFKIRKKTKMYFYDAMKIFYKKHYEIRYPWLVNRLVYGVIDLKKKLS